MLLTKESSGETITFSSQSLMTDSSRQAAHENGTVLDSEVGLFLCLPWVRVQGSGHCENLLRTLGWEVLSWARGPLVQAFWEQMIVSLRRALLDGRVVFAFIIYQRAQWRSEWRLNQPKVEALLPAYFY
jgi:hypothetical protein